MRRSVVARPPHPADRRARQPGLTSKDNALCERLLDVLIQNALLAVMFRRVQRAFVLHKPLRVSHGWDNTVKCSFDELAGSAVELVVAIFQAV